MGLLDRFRTQPEWKHEDPAVRATAVRDLSEEEQDLFLAIATEDADPGVRRLAVTRLTDAEALGRITRHDADESVRNDALSTLRGLATDASDVSQGLAAVSALADERDLTAVARGARLEPVAGAALTRLHDQKAIAAVSRRTPHALVALDALSRLTDLGEIFTVVVKADDKAVVLAALERLLTASPDKRELLTSVTRRAKSKFATRRARSLLRAMDLAAGLPEAPGVDPVELCQSLEGLAAGELETARQRLPDAIDRWEQLLETNDGVSEEIRVRFEGAREALEARLAAADAAREAARATEAEKTAARASAIASRRRLCEAVRALAADVDHQRLTELRDEWTRLEPISSGPDLSGVEREFEHVCRAFDNRRTAARSADARAEEMASLLAAMEQLVSESAPDQVRERWRAVHKRWLALTAMGPVAGEDTFNQRFAAVEERRKAQEMEIRRARERTQTENLARLVGVCEAAERVARAEQLDLRDAERTVRSIRAALDALGPLPSKRDREDLTKRLKTVLTEVLGRARELRDFADWQRWANVGVQEELCQRLEALAAVESVPQVARDLRDIMIRWREAADVPREQSGPLRDRFQRAYNAVHPRCAAYFAQLAAERDANQSRRIALCEEAERLSGSTDWIKTAQRITELQAEWRTVGPLSRQQQKELWNRFRAACGQFFQRRKADLAVRKKEWAANLERKEALCARVEALAETTDWDSAMTEVKRLQAEWKTIGPVRRSRSEAVWQRFRAAGDQFFTRYQQRDQRELAEQLAQREAMCQELESLLQPGNGERPEPPADLAERVRDLRARWRQAPDLPRERSRVVIARFNNALARVLEQYADTFKGGDLDATRNLRRLEQLCQRVEALLSSNPDDAGQSPAEILARRWREALAANTMGARVDEEARRRSAVEEVRRVQAERRKMGPVPGESGRLLAQRFQRACDQFFQQLPGAQRSPSDARAAHSTNA